MMIKYKKYLKALATVEAYHRQVLNDCNLVQSKGVHNKYKSIDDLQIGDLLECVEVHGNSSKNLTKGKTYETINLSDKYFYIISDKGRKKFYGLGNSQFKVLK